MICLVAEMLSLLQQLYPSYVMQSTADSDDARGGSGSGKQTAECTRQADDVMQSADDMKQGKPDEEEESANDTKEGKPDA